MTSSARCTELGVDRIEPVRARRSVVRGTTLGPRPRSTRLRDDRA